jgi:hypothetical protein
MATSILDTAKTAINMLTACKKLRGDCKALIFKESPVVKQAEIDKLQLKVDLEATEMHYSDSSRINLASAKTMAATDKCVTYSLTFGHGSSSWNRRLPQNKLCIPLRRARYS